MKKLSLLGLIALLIIGCSGGQSEQASQSAGTPALMDSQREAMADAGKPGEEAPLVSLPRKIIYTGHVRLVTENIEEASSKLEASLKGFGAYVGDSSKNGSRDTVREASWTVRIPVQQYDPFLKFVRSLGELKSDTRQAQDVSEEYYDVEARLKNKRIEEARLVELLKNATGKLSEILTVEKEINRVREECERIEGRLRFLRNQSDLSTVTISIQEIKNYQPEGPPNLQTQVGRSFGGSIDVMKQLGTGLLLMFVALVPWLVPIALIAFIVMKVMRKPKKESPEPPPIDFEP